MIGGVRARALVALAVVLIVVGVLPVGLMYARVHPVRTSTRDDPGRYGIAFQESSFPSSRDAVGLRGWYMPAPAPSGRTVVIVPGIDDDRGVSGITVRLAPALLARGIDVLAFDLRAEGSSEGDLQTFGADEQWDVLGAVAEAQRRGARSVGVLGFSLGAAASVLAAARSTDIAALVTDSAFADLSATLRHELAVNDHLPGPAVDYGLLLFRLLSGVDPSTVSPVRAIDALGDRPVLLIQGDADSTVEPADLDRLARAAGTRAERWLVPGGQHARSYYADPAGYVARVVAFFDRSLR